MITVKEASNILNVSTTTIRNWIKQSKLKATKPNHTWQIERASLPEARARKQASNREASQMANSIVKQVVQEVKNIIEPFLQERQSSTEPEPSLDQLKQAELEKNVYEEIDNLYHQNKSLKEKVASLEQELVSIKAMLRKPEPEAIEQKATDIAEPVYCMVPDQQTSSQIRDEAKAEKWVRENIGEWIDQGSRLNKAKNRTWKELATNEGKKIEINGCMQVPRAYLHIIEKSNQMSTWSKMKAKVVLEVFQKEAMIYQEDKKMTGVVRATPLQS